MSVRTSGYLVLPLLLVALAGFAAGLQAGTVTLEWDANSDSDLAGYNVYFGVVEMETINTVFVQETTATLHNLQVGATYFFYVTALNSFGLESEPSETITYTLPEPLPVIVNQPPVVNAGPDHTITLPATATLNGIVEDDGLPNPPGFVTTQWSTISGPAGVIIHDTAALATTVSFPTAGTYMLRLTADDGELSSSDEITIVVEPMPNTAPVVFAGADQTITLPASATLNGIVEDDGLPNPPGLVTTQWSTVSGPGSVSFHDAGALATTVSFSTAGTFVLRLTADDGELSSSDDVTVVVTELQAGTVTLEWDANSDSDVVGYNVYYGVVGREEIETVFVHETTATLHDLEVGATYFFYVTALNSFGLESEPSETITYTIPGPLPVIVNRPPVVNAGPDQTITLPEAATLNGTVEDDGLPNPPGFVTTQWSTISGPAGVIIHDTAVLATTVSFPTAGTYVLRLTADDGELGASDRITITVLPVPEPPSAESQQVETLEGTAVQITLRGLDPNDQPLSFVVVNLPTKGTLSGVSPDLVYTPQPGFTGLDSFTFRAQNAQLASEPATIAIEVLPAESEDGDEGESSAPGLAFITEFPDQTTPRNRATHPIPFVVQGGETPADELMFWVFSSDMMLVPWGNIVIEGEGTNRTLTVTPVASQTGTATITVWLSDGKAMAAQAFSVTVYGPLDLASPDTAPKQAAAISEVQFSPGQGSGHETLLRWSGQSGQIFAVETSSDLANWQGTPASLHEITPGQYESRLWPETGGTGFFRLRWLQAK